MNNTYNWYSQLLKPSWAPPSWLFGPVWSFLYILIFVSFGKVFWMAWEKKLPWFVVLPFVLNLFFNFIFTYIQFGLKNNLLAAFTFCPKPCGYFCFGSFMECFFHFYLWKAIKLLSLYFLLKH